MSDLLSNFKKQIDNFPKNAGDLNIICSITYGEYKIYLTMLNALLLPQTIIKRQLSELNNLINNETYNHLMSGLNKLNTTLNSILPQPFNKNMTMDFNVGRVGNLLTTTCADFLGSVPESLFNIFQDIENGLIDVANLTNGLLELPSNLVGNIANSLLQLKDQAMKDMFGELFDTILSPLIDYENFLLNNGIQSMIKKMVKIENCMTKPGICNRPRIDFTHPTSKKLYSEHYRNQFMMTSNGSIDLRFLTDDKAQRSKMNNVIKNMSAFRLTVH